jgi:hypothetical protein
MTRKKITFDTVRRIGLALPDVEAGTAYGSPALKVRGKMFACMAAHKSAEPNSLVLRLDLDQRDALIAEEPSVYYITDHYVPYPAVLVRLASVADDALEDLVRMAWKFESSRAPRARRPRGTPAIRSRRRA